MFSVNSTFNYWFIPLQVHVLSQNMLGLFWVLHCTTKCRNKRSKLQPFICFGRDWHTWTKLSPDHPAISWAPRTCECVLLLELNLEATLKRGNNQCAKRLFIYACFDKGHCIYLSINQCRPKVDMCSSFNILDWIPLFEWCVVMYGSKNG